MDYTPYYGGKTPNKVSLVLGNLHIRCPKRNHTGGCGYRSSKALNLQKHTFDLSLEGLHEP